MGHNPDLRDILLKWRKKMYEQKEILKRLIINDEPLVVVQIQLNKCLAMEKGYERYLERYI